MKRLLLLLLFLAVSAPVHGQVLFSLPTMPGAHNAGGGEEGLTLAHHWDFEEASGSLTDQEGGNTLTPTGGISPTYQVDDGTGDMGITGNGTGRYEMDSDIAIPDGTLRIEAKVEFNDTADSQDIVRNSDLGNNNGWEFKTQGTGRIRFSAGNGTTFQNGNLGSSRSTGVVYVFVLDYDPDTSEASMTINGGSPETATLSGVGQISQASGGLKDVLAGGTYTIYDLKIYN